jgi:hypothetical protein
LKFFERLGWERRGWVRLGDGIWPRARCLSAGWGGAERVTSQRGAGWRIIERHVWGPYDMGCGRQVRLSFLKISISIILKQGLILPQNFVRHVEPVENPVNRGIE